MKNIVLFCSAGMTTSLLVKKMQDHAEKIGYDVNIHAHSVSEIAEAGKDADIILLGPQVRFQLDNVKKAHPDKKIEVIDMRDYGMMNGEKVLEDAKALID